jgi:hypothetical protein
MSASTITTMSRRRRRARRLIALALGVCALAIPASAAAQPIDNEQNWPVAVSAEGSRGPLPSASIAAPASAAEGFDWGDAALGAGATMALVALGGTVLFTVRRPGVSPSASTG